MDSLCYWWAVDDSFAPKPTPSSFHFQWRISVLGRSLFLYCSFVTLGVAATGLDPMRPGCGFYKVALCVRLYNELVQLSTWSVYGCCEATKKSRHHDCAMCQLTSISSVIPLCLVIFALVRVLYLTFSSCRIVVRVFSALLEIFFSCML